MVKKLTENALRSKLQQRVCFLTIAKPYTIFLNITLGERPMLSADYGGCKYEATRSNLTCFITISQLHISFSDQLYPPREAPSANVQP